MRETDAKRTVRKACQEDGSRTTQNPLSCCRSFFQKHARNIVASRPFQITLYVIGSAYALAQAIAIATINDWRALNPFTMHLCGQYQSLAILSVVFLCVAVACPVVMIRIGEPFDWKLCFVAFFVGAGLFLTPYLALGRLALLVPLALLSVVIVGKVFLTSRRILLTTCCLVLCVSVASLSSVLLAEFGIVNLASARTVIPAGVRDSPNDVIDDMRSGLEGTPLRVRSFQEICELGQRFVHVECSTLQISEFEPRCVVTLTGRAYASFDPIRNRICISAVMLRTSGCTLSQLYEILAHEVAHALEYAAVDGKVSISSDTPFSDVTPEDVAMWRREFSQPGKPLQDWDSYVSQDNEMRARSYASRALDKYFLADGVDGC